MDQSSDNRRTWGLEVAATDKESSFFSLSDDELEGQTKNAWASIASEMGYGDSNFQLVFGEKDVKDSKELAATLKEQPNGVVTVNFKMKELDALPEGQKIKRIIADIANVHISKVLIEFILQHPESDLAFIAPRFYDHAELMSSVEVLSCFRWCTGQLLSLACVFDIFPNRDISLASFSSPTFLPLDCVFAEIEIESVLQWSLVSAQSHLVKQNLSITFQSILFEKENRTLKRVASNFLQSTYNLGE